MKLRNIVFVSLFSFLALSCASIDKERQPSSEDTKSSDQEHIQRALERMHTRR